MTPLQRPLCLPRPRCLFQQLFSWLAFLLFAAGGGEGDGRFFVLLPLFIWLR